MPGQGIMLTSCKGFEQEHEIVAPEENFIDFFVEVNYGENNVLKILHLSKINCRIVSKLSGRVDRRWSST